MDLRLDFNIICGFFTYKLHPLESLLICSLEEIRSRFGFSVQAGQLGNCGRTPGSNELYPGATEAGGLLAEKEEMAFEGLAQGRKGMCS